jgi:hypothetical protein
MAFLNIINEKSTSLYFFLYLFTYLFIYKVRENSLCAYAVSVLQRTEIWKSHIQNTVGGAGSKFVMSRSFLPVRVGHFQISVLQ